MEHLLRLTSIERPAHQWRAATLIVAGVAAFELVLLLLAGSALLGRSETVATVKPAHRAKAVAPGNSSAGKGTKVVAVTATSMIPRRKVGVLVLNGNGRTGAAAAAAARVSHRGYRVRGVGNATTHDYVHSIVMYRPGFRAEGARLAHDLGVKIIGPLDGMRPSQLNGAHAVLILGS